MNTAAVQHCFVLRPSRWPGRIELALLALSSIACLTDPGLWPLGVVGGALAVWLGHRRAARERPWLRVELRIDAGGRVEWRGSDVDSALHLQITDDSVVVPGLIALRLRSTATGERRPVRSLLLMADSAPPDTLRRLHVLLHALARADQADERI